MCKKCIAGITTSPWRLTYRLTVSRSSIFADSVSHFKQRNFDFKKTLKVRFEGEPAIDGGGPKREFFTITLRALDFHIFQKQFMPTSKTQKLMI